MSAVRGPRVSVIIPAHNAERYIRESLDSVLAQTYSDYEVIVVDDGSTDETKNRVLAVNGPVRCITQSNAGPAAARNVGIRASVGELVCFLDADDLWTPEKLQRQVEFMDGHPAVGLVFSDEEEFDDNGVHCPSLLATTRYGAALAGAETIDAAFQKLLEENFIPTSTVMARRDCFERAGVFEVALRASEDCDMWSRIAACVPIACLPAMLGRKRVVATSVSRDVETTLRSRIVFWTRALRLFPDRVRPQTVNALLAPTYLQLGFVLLHKGESREPRQFSVKALRASRRPSEWLLASSLFVLTLTGRGVVESLFSTKRRFVQSFRPPVRPTPADGRLRR